MSFRFRPRLDCLEARDVPAAFSATLSNGLVMAGSFSSPAGVDPALDDQTLYVPDLVVQVGGVAFGAGSFTDTPTAHYSFGQLDGVGFIMDDPNGPVYTLVSVGGNQAAVTPTGGSTGFGTAFFDAADTQATFTLPDGTTGSLSYTIPWDQVDPDQASQSLTLTAFNLNIAGQNFTYGSASYTTAPTLLFEYGDLVGISFAVDTSMVFGFAYSSISIANGIATAQLAANGQFINAPVANQTASVIIDFSAISIPAAGQGAVEVKIRVTAGTTVQSVTVEIQPGATKAQVRNAFQDALTSVGFSAVSDGDTGLRIKGTTGANPAQLLKVETFFFGANPPRLATRTAAPDGSFPTYTNNN